MFDGSGIQALINQGLVIVIKSLKDVNDLFLIVSWQSFWVVMQGQLPAFRQFVSAELNLAVSSAAERTSGAELMRWTIEWRDRSFVHESFYLSYTSTVARICPEGCVFGNESLASTAPAVLR